MQPGDHFERYTIEGVLGSGGMGRVYKAHDPKLGRDVAIKVLLPGISDKDGSAAAPSDEAKARILREARAAAALTHPNAVAIYDVGESDAGGPYIVMELVTGESLRDMINDPQVTSADKIRWLKETASALAAAHDRGIVHRDVKPDNVIVRTDGVAKVLDFGIARRASGAADPSAPTEAPLPTLTELGAQIGTPLYMAPEQIKGDPVDGRSDQFAWGVVAYELFAGKLPWRADKGQLGVAASILTDAPAPLAAAPKAIAALVKRALEKDPANRFSSMRDVIAAFDSEESETSENQDTSEARVSQRPKLPARNPEPVVVEPARARSPSLDPRRYDTAQFKEIFQRALERQESEGRYEHEDLVEAARELGIRDDVLEQTVADVELAVTRERLNVARQADERRRGIARFWRIAISLVLANVMMFVFMHGFNKWAIYGSIVALAVQLRNTYFPREKPFGATRGDRRRERREERRARKASGRSEVSGDSEARIEEGVRVLLSTTQKKAARVRVAANVGASSGAPATPSEEHDAEDQALAEEEASPARKRRR